MFTSTKASAALLALHALGVSAHYLPRNVEPFFKRDANTYRLSSRVIERRAAGPTAGLKIQGDDVIYFANMVIGGKELTVQVDTGSTDLWVYVPDGSIKFSNTTDIEVPLAYGTGNLTGHITFADVEFGPYQIPNQAFVNATATQDFDTMFDRNIVGILGLSFSERTSTMVPSTVNAVLEQKYGNDTHLGESVIGNIFLQSPSLPNSFDVLIGRSIAENDISEGYFSIGEHVPGFENVAKKPKLPRISSGRWGVAVDGFEVNGQQIPFQNKSVVPGAPDGKIIGVLDTGATLAQVPPNLVKALYGSIPGAIFEETTGLWFLPCDATTDFTVVMGGEPIPIHPLDISRVLVTEFAVNGKNQNVTFCTNSWQPFSLPENFAGLDALLGDAFLRNVYASFDFGDQGTEDNSFIQLLPIYESAKAHAEFPQLRAEQLKGRPPALSPADIIKLIEQADAAETATAVASSTVAPNTPAATPAATRSASRPQSTPTNDDDGDNDNSEAVGSAVRLSDGTDGSAVGILDKWGPVIIGLLAGNLVVTLILCIIGIAMCVNNRKGYRVRNTVSYGPVLTRERDGTEYSDSFLAKGDH